MTRQQHTPSGANDPNAKSASVTPAAASGAGSTGATGRDAQSDKSEIERSIPTTQEDTKRHGSSNATDQTSSRSRAPSLTRWGFPSSPWELMRRMTEDLNRAAESLREARGGTSTHSARSSIIPSSTAGTSMGLAHPAAWVPDIEVLRGTDSLVVRADLPGVSPDDIEISIEDGMLTVAGERRQEQRADQHGVIRTERSYGNFLRTIVLPDGADDSHIEARVSNGVLEVVVPVAVENRSRRIPVQS